MSVEMVDRQLHGAAIAPIDTRVELVTPENIAFHYQLAGPFRRFPAWLVDFCLKSALLTSLIFFFFMLGIPLGSFGVSLMMGLYLVVAFLIFWFYGVFFEAFFNGKTPGKWAFGLRVVSTDGHPVSGVQTMLRNLLRIADLMPPVVPTIIFGGEEFPWGVPTGIVGFVVMACNHRMQRLGDLAAGTMVIVDERAWSLPVVQVKDARVMALASFIPADFRVTPTLSKALAQFAERRGYLSPARRREVARRLAEPLTKRFEFRPDIDPDLLLYSLYWRTFLADSKQWTGELGPLAGYSPLLRDMNKAAPLPEAPPVATESPQSPDVVPFAVPVAVPVARAESEPPVLVVNENEIVIEKEQP